MKIGGIEFADGTSYDIIIQTVFAHYEQRIERLEQRIQRLEDIVFPVMDTDA